MSEGNKAPVKNPARGISLACMVLTWFIVGQLAVSFFTSELETFYVISQFTSGSFEDIMAELADLAATDTYTALTGILTELIIAVWFGIRYKKDIYNPSVAIYGTMRERLAKTKPLAIVAAILLAVIGFIFLVQYSFEALNTVSPQTMLDYTDQIEDENLDSFSILMVIYTVIAAPIAEELTFRGLMMGYMEKEMNFWLANAIQAFLFAFVHGSLVQGVYTFCLGFIFGYIMHKTQNILCPILGHLLFNLIGVYLNQYLLLAGTPITAFICIFLSMAAIYAGYLLLNRFSGIEEQKKEDFIA